MEGIEGFYDPPVGGESKTQGQFPPFPQNMIQFLLLWRELKGSMIRQLAENLKPRDNSLHFHIRRKIESYNIIQQYKINNQIKAPELRIIDETGENLGIMPLEAALKLAQDKELDLIEIASMVKPPVAKIISFDKFRYQKEKELKKQKSLQKTSELKQVQITAKAAKNDLEIRAKKINEFLTEGNKIEIILVLKGREKYNRDWARYKLEEFLKMITIEYKTTMSPKFIGRGIVMQVTKK